MDFQQFLDFLSGRPAQARAAGVGDLERGAENSEREAQREDYRRTIAAAQQPQPDNSDLYAILQRNLANPEFTPQHAEMYALRDQALGPIQDMAANAQSDLAFLESNPPLASRGPQEIQMSALSAFQPDPPPAAAQAPAATKHIQIPQEVMPPAAPPPEVPMPAGMTKPPQAPSVMAPRQPVIGPGGAGAEHFLPPEVFAPQPRPTPQVIGPQRYQPAPLVIGPGGVGANLPFAPTIRAGALAPAEPEPVIPAIQRNGWMSPPARVPSPTPSQPTRGFRQAPAAEPQPTADDLNRAELQRLLASFDQPPVGAPPPAQAAPTPEAPRTVPDTSNQIKPPAPPKLGEQMPEILKEQLLQEAIRISRGRREAASGGAR